VRDEVRQMMLCFYAENLFETALRVDIDQQNALPSLRRGISFAGCVAADRDLVSGSYDGQPVGREQAVLRSAGTHGPSALCHLLVIAGADLNIKLLTTLGVLGAIYDVTQNPKMRQRES
jgi:hypothetical protein